MAIKSFFLLVLMCCCLITFYSISKERVIITDAVSADRYVITTNDKDSAVLIDPLAISNKKYFFKKNDNEHISFEDRRIFFGFKQWLNIILSQNDTS